MIQQYQKQKLKWKEQGRAERQKEILEIIDNIQTDFASLDWCYKEQLKEELGIKDG